MANLWVGACDGLEVLIFEDGVVAYDDRNGDTHFLNPVTHFVLSTLADRPMVLQDLVNALGSEFGATVTPEERLQVERMLTQLQALNLVRCTPASGI